MRGGPAAAAAMRPPTRACRMAAGSSPSPGRSQGITGRSRPVAACRSDRGFRAVRRASRPLLAAARTAGFRSEAAAQVAGSPRNSRNPHDSARITHEFITDIVRHSAHQCAVERFAGTWCLRGPGTRGRRKGEASGHRPDECRGGQAMPEASRESKYALTCGGSGRAAEASSSPSGDSVPHRALHASALDISPEGGPAA